MSTDVDMRERHGRVLAEMAEVGMAMVRRLGETMLRTEDVRVQAQIGQAFHRVSRTVRQTIALEFRLAQAARADASDASLAAAPVARPAASPPPSPPRAARERTGWNEHERPDCDEALDALEDLLDTEDPDPETLREALGASMARLRQDLTDDGILVQACVAASDGANFAHIDTDRPPGTSTTPERRNRRSELMGATGFAGFSTATLPQAAARASPSPWRSSA